MAGQESRAAHADGQPVVAWTIQATWVEMASSLDEAIAQARRRVPPSRLETLNAYRSRRKDPRDTARRVEDS